MKETHNTTKLYQPNYEGVTSFNVFKKKWNELEGASNINQSQIRDTYGAALVAVRPGSTKYFALNPTWCLTIENRKVLSKDTWQQWLNSQGLLSKGWHLKKFRILDAIWLKEAFYVVAAKSLFLKLDQDFRFQSEFLKIEENEFSASFSSRSLRKSADNNHILVIYQGKSKIFTLVDVTREGQEDHIKATLDITKAINNEFLYDFKTMKQNRIVCQTSQSHQILLIQYTFKNAGEWSILHRLEAVKVFAPQQVGNGRDCAITLAGCHDYNLFATQVRTNSMFGLKRLSLVEIVGRRLRRLISLQNEPGLKIVSSFVADLEVVNSRFAVFILSPYEQSAKLNQFIFGRRNRKLLRVRKFGVLGSNLFHFGKVDHKIVGLGYFQTYFEVTFGKGVD